MSGQEVNCKSIVSLIVKEYAFSLAFKKMYDTSHLCCGYKHKEFSVNPTSNVKCYWCGKYTATKRFTTHMEKCMKKQIK